MLDKLQKLASMTDAEIEILVDKAARKAAPPQMPQLPPQQPNVALGQAAPGVNPNIVQLLRGGQ